MIDEKEVQLALGLFPIPGAPKVARQRARKLAVEYGHRRVDTKSRLYRVTEFLLTRLAPLLPSPGQTPVMSPPLECLMTHQTPQETAICLADVRRNLRTRAFIDWRAQSEAGRGAGVSQPHPPPPPPTFLSIGMLIPLLQSHLAEPGVPEAYGALFSSLNPTPLPPNIVANKERFSAAVFNSRGGGGGEGEAMQVVDEEEDPGMLEEGLRQVNVDGELMIVIEN